MCCPAQFLDKIVKGRFGQNVGESAKTFDVDLEHHCPQSVSIGETIIRWALTMTG